jgi:hypothetical protein
MQTEHSIRGAENVSARNTYVNLIDIRMRGIRPCDVLISVTLARLIVVPIIKSYPKENDIEWIENTENRDY